MLAIYHSLFSSRLNYSNLVWGKMSEENSKKLLILQKKFPRIAGNVPKTFHTQELFPKHKILPIAELYNFCLCHALKGESANTSFFFHELTLNKATKYTTLEISISGTLEHTEHMAAKHLKTYYQTSKCPLLQQYCPRNHLMQEAVRIFFTDWHSIISIKQITALSSSLLYVRDLFFFHVETTCCNYLLWNYLLHSTTCWMYYCIRHMYCNLKVSPSVSDAKVQDQVAMAKSSCPRGSFYYGQPATMYIVVVK